MLASGVHEDLGWTEAVDDLRHDAPDGVEIKEIAADRQPVDLTGQGREAIGAPCHQRLPSPPPRRSARPMPAPSPDDACQ